MIKRFKEKDGPAITNPPSTTIDNNKNFNKASKESEYELEAEKKVKQFLSHCSVLESGDHSPIMIKRIQGGLDMFLKSTLGLHLYTMTF